ncbi:MAG: VOC family protein, partial [Flavisolibacter sp.]|nr:VOC family protein [Flavisolibacter sp.]
MLNHIAITVKNLEKSASFYRNLLQLDTIPEPFKDGKHAWFRVGEHSQLHVIEAKG